MTPIEILALIDKPRLQDIQSAYAAQFDLTILIEDYDGGSLTEISAFHNGEKIAADNTLKGLRLFLTTGTHDALKALSAGETIVTTFHNGEINRAIIPLIYDDMFCATVHLIQFKDENLFSNLLLSSTSPIYSNEIVLEHMDSMANLADKRFLNHVKIFDTFISNFFASEAARIKQSRAVKKLARKETQYNEFFREIEDGIILTTPSFDVIDCNRFSLEILDYTHNDEVIGLNLLNHLIPDQKQRARISNELTHWGHIENFWIDFSGKTGKKVGILLSASKKVEDPDKIVGYRFQIKSTESDPLVRDESEATAEDTLDPSESIIQDISELAIGSDYDPADLGIDLLQEDISHLSTKAPDDIKTKGDEIFIQSQNEYNNVLQELDLAARDYRKIVDHLPEIVFGFNQDNVIKLWNKTAEIALGFQKAKVINQPIDKIILKTKQNLDKISAITKAPVDIEFLKSDRSSVLLRVHSTITTLEGQEIVLAIAHDHCDMQTPHTLLEYARQRIGQLLGIVDSTKIITENNGHQDRLKIEDIKNKLASIQSHIEKYLMKAPESEKLPGIGQNLSKLFSTFQIGIAQITVDKRIIPLNERFCQIFNRTESEFAKLKYDRLVHKSDREQMSGYWDKILETREQGIYQTFYGMQKGGKKLRLACATALLRNEKEFGGFLMIVILI